ncbi:hypothetical protein BUE80_DR010779 [Diplocarpon rosae]|nr:hypothetical protein BUE80_DR010779 [Diplocarpon rosae]
MRLSTPLISVATSAFTSATNLYVSSYAGTVSTLSLSEAAGAYTLTTTSVNSVPDTNPSWLTKDERSGLVYLVDEGFTGSSSVSTFSTSRAGELTLLGRSVTVSGPVSSTIYNGGKGLALAHYGGSAVSSWKLQANGTLAHLQDFFFNLTAPGAVPERQEAPHPHQVLVDVDLVRIFRIDKTTSALTELTPFATPAGSGPRHGAFLKTAYGNTYFYLISELSNTLVSYNVTYAASSLGFEQVFVSGTYGPADVPEGAAAAEVLVSPDTKFLLTSDRNATFFDIPNPDQSNGTTIPSDTLQSWAIDDATGTLSLVQLAPAGGKYPRQFSVNKAGTLAAVVLQKDGRVVIMQRDVATGKFGSVLASVNQLGEVSCVIWDE